MLRGATSRSRGRARIAAQGAAVLALAGLLTHAAVLLAGPPLRGMADNGDFWRVGRGAGLVVVDDPEMRNRYVWPSFERGEGGLADAFSSAALLVRTAADLPPRDPQRVSLPRIGLFYLSLASLALALGLLRGMSPIACAAIAWVLVSPANLLMLNSLHADAAAVVGMLAIVVGLARRPGTARAQWLPDALVLFGVFLTTWSKQLHAGIGVAAALALTLRRPPGDRVPTVALLAGLITFGAAAHFGAGAGLRFPQINGYHSVFFGIADVSSDPERVLREHELSAYSDRVGTHFFAARVPRDLAERVEALSRTRVALQYLRDPRAMGRTLGIVRRELVASDGYLGNHARSAGAPEREIYREAWSFDALRETLLRPAPVLALAALLALAWNVRRRRPWRAPGPGAPRASASTTVAFLALTVAFESAAVVLGDGFFAIGRHLHLARFALDLLFALALAAALEAALRAVLRR